ncbi:unnamed protein product [Jaminaea pallidilutea]
MSVGSVRSVIEDQNANGKDPTRLKLAVVRRIASAERVSMNLGSVQFSSVQFSSVQSVFATRWRNRGILCASSTSLNKRRHPPSLDSGSHKGAKHHQKCSLDGIRDTLRS